MPLKLAVLYPFSVSFVNNKRSTTGRGRLEKRSQAMQQGVRISRGVLSHLQGLKCVKDGNIRGTAIRSLSSINTQRADQLKSICPEHFSGSSRYQNLLTKVICATGAVAASVQAAEYEGEWRPRDTPEDDTELHEVINWSGTHTVETRRYYQPETIEELKALVKNAHIRRRKLRPVGSALSPNGLGFEKGGMVNLVLLDKILEIDKEKKQIRVQAGARVNQVVDALRPHGLTLQNFASITEQQIGGFTQVGAHGSGAKIPPVDEQVVGLKVITPAAGELELSENDEDPSLFQLARASLGMIGVVSEVTLQCVEAHKLIEETYVTTRAELESQHKSLMEKNRHLRYMWIPHTEHVVVVTCNLYEGAGSDVFLRYTKYSDSDRLAAPRELLRSHPDCTLSDVEIIELAYTALRDELLALDPLNVEWVKKVNLAEAEFWKRSEGTRVDWSDKILQFDCGGQQWVSEVAFPAPSNDANNLDVKFVQDILDLIEKEGIPAPAPIEQRWSAPSFSPMSPAGEKPTKELADIYSWVGIIMYLPDASLGNDTRERITCAFKEYKSLCEERLWQDVHAVEHWAKVELPDTEEGRARLRNRTFEKYPTEAFKAICAIFDPHGILRNELMDSILGIKTATQAAKPETAHTS